jgi:hypothetical protein
MSLSATAIRLVEYGSYPAMLICSNIAGRQWYMASSTVSGELWPSDSPGETTQATALLHRDVLQQQDHKANEQISGSRTFALINIGSKKIQDYGPTIAFFH